MSADRKFRSLAAVCAILVASLAALPRLQAQTPAPELGGAARLLNFTGQISVMHDADAWALNAGDLVQPGQVVVTGPEGYGVFQVADGSRFEVFPKSRVVFRANRGDWTDLLEVWLGKIRATIEHPGGLPNHNKVHTPSAVISVRGTVFDVEVEDENATTLVLDEEGSVEVRHLLRVSEPRLLRAGEWVRVFRNEALAQKMIDRGNILQRAARAASDALYQAGINAARNAPSIARTGGVPGTGSPADQNNGQAAPTAPPPPPSAPPPPAH